MTGVQTCALPIYGSVGTSGADLNMNSVSITTGSAVAVTSFTYTENKG